MPHDEAGFLPHRSHLTEHMRASSVNQLHAFERFEREADALHGTVSSAAARSRPVANQLGQVLRVGGRSLFMLSIGLSLYEIATSNNPGQTARQEAAVFGASLAGSVAGGALAGLACGPGAPVCVTIGAFVGGAMFALGVSGFLR
jgi:fermentation-respiration switch protein FrsA (DUF1100 family)